MYSNISQIMLLYKTWRYCSKFGIIGGTLPMCENIKMRVNWVWIERHCVFCSKTKNTLHSCHNFPTDSREAARVARICETSLLKHYLPPYILRMLYFSMVNAHLNYGILVWGFVPTRLIKIQKSTIRTITCSKYNAYIEPLFKILDILRLKSCSI